MGLDLELDLGGKFELAIGKQTDELARKLAPCKPILNRAVGAIQYGGNSAEAYIDLGSPNTGRLWELTSITLYGADAYTTVANVKCAVYFGDSMVPSLSSLVVPNLSAPSFTDLSDETLYCESTANIVIGVFGTGTGQVGASITYRDWPEAVLVARNGVTMP